MDASHMRASPMRSAPRQSWRASRFGWTAMPTRHSWQAQGSLANAAASKTMMTRRSRRTPQMDASHMRASPMRSAPQQSWRASRFGWTAMPTRHCWQAQGSLANAAASKTCQKHRLSRLTWAQLLVQIMGSSFATWALLLVQIRSLSRHDRLIFAIGRSQHLHPSGFH